MRITAQVLLVVLALIATSGVQAKTRLVVNCIFPPQDFVCKEILPNWLAAIEEKTDGRVSGIIPPKTVAPPAEQLSSVESGMVDVAIQFNGLIANRVTGPLVAMNPFIATNDSAAMSQALWETSRKFFPDEFKNVHLLSLWVKSPAELFSLTDEPVNTMADLKARKIWVIPGTLSELTKSIGSGVVATPAVKSNEIISRGVVDAYLGLDPHLTKNFQLIPYTKSMTRFNNSIYSSSFSVFINKDKWAEISEADRKVITELSGSELGKAAGAAWRRSIDEALKTFSEAGIKIVDADPEFEAELQKASEFLTRQWIAKANEAGIDGQAAYDYYVSRVRELSAD
ncbi:TRAP transporter substrate-binding protein DctP [Halomonas sp. LR5S13]|uniref:TRAP transporter substrate-binding protein DctP n=1 Tax=Halomonas rhizosphaerae TaxID=3043296 RepID=UPI0024A84775|nr:TRAP transporter substrate-binding protein DctP [Halomonas rhizosphaerae]MDI5922676.1 TRAP transporter substrate-binding protein DctP [Halomonas rhizosphaerae]